MHRPKLGQHFLRDPRLAETILQAAELKSTDTVLEIGPGQGVLTEKLIERAGRLVAVELDRGLASRLEARFADRPAWRLVQGDFLQSNLPELFPAASPEHPIKVLGNLPYAITSPILEKVLVWPGWHTAVFLVQREVGDRMRAPAGSKTFGILSLSVQLFADVEAIALVRPGAFHPAPNVISQIVRLRRRRTLPLPDTMVPAFFDLAHAAFSHRRKTMANSLTFFSGKPKAEVERWLFEQGVSPRARAETLPLAQYVKLCDAWAIFRREKNLT